MWLIDKFIPEFWHDGDASGMYKQLFNYRRLWKEAALISVVIVFLPLVMLTAYEYKVTKATFESEALARASRFVAKTRRTESFLLSKKRFALEFIIHDNTFEQLLQPGRLTVLLENLNRGLGLFADLGVIDAAGIQRAYSGPFHLENADYSSQPWFKEIQNRGIFISDVFMGLRNLPHIVIAVKRSMPGGSFYVLRTSVSIERLTEILSHEQTGEVGDAFLINHEGVLQTPSRYFGEVLGKVPLAVPEFSDHTEGYQLEGMPVPGAADTRLPETVADGTLVVSYAYVENSPFILMLVSPKAELMAQWRQTRMKILIFLSFTVGIILLVLLCVVTYLVNAIHTADQKRVMMLHEIEYSEKMASIGRLAAGIAHEINNPLAIINEKAGLIQDLFMIKEQYKQDAKLLGLIASIVSSVERCSVITRRLLSFARQSEATVTRINLHKIITEVLSFLGKEPEYRSITIKIDIDDGIEDIVSDKGKLQQVLLNIIKNAFAAVEDGGNLGIAVRKAGSGAVELSISDDGCGIPPEDLAKIFEPFFTTKGGRGGTGLGLSITYGLVSELGGTIRVTSEQGKGTCFIITLPLTMAEHKG
ncbi:integral membrane sensor signal transduction histidine kinase [Desulfobulbus propionicus DSM 2032]|jgi:signal transduction histidine kinase|uniref:histidine kinase n=1 Tax=Desulfobulbus propionicus (strain ATCC 33891 / DSM 2032 / VKM B-1956 / 1pr3) TaxID=577650 RepID=A0A7U4DQD5_DESPD|nr:ATP-binding protein [Desulfobulbus propionicus]ADW18984.1 integral membrane sensor signal transduction histidine kinase [Desulfobulbus propionicus DSM 2032]